MAELDLSHHTLNNSSSKQKFSFPKTHRFRDNHNSLCESIYDMPSTRSNRAASFGYGKKDMGLRIDRYMAPVGTYELGTEFKKDEHKGFGFGSGREEMQLGGPLKDTKVLAFIPGPGKYESNKSQLDHRGSSLRAKLPDTTIKHLQKNPGPGAYKFDQMGSSLYYQNSKFRNDTNGKISPGSRLAQIARKSTLDVGPGSYTINVEDLNTQGRYKLSNHESSRARIFDRAPKMDIVPKHTKGTPGPGQQQRQLFLFWMIPLLPIYFQPVSRCYYRLDKLKHYLYCMKEEDRDNEPPQKNFIAQLEKIQKIQAKMEVDLPYQLTMEIPLKRTDPDQQFYRTIEDLSQKSLPLRKLGWKIADLSRQQQDLTLYCLSILSAQCIMPLHFFPNSVQSEGRTSIWMEVAIHLSSQTLDLEIVEQNSTMEINIYNFCRSQLLTLLRNFIRDNITWERMMQQDYSELQLIEKFKKEVVETANKLISMEDLKEKKK